MSRTLATVGAALALGGSVIPDRRLALGAQIGGVYLLVTNLGDAFDLAGSLLGETVGEAFEEAGQTIQTLGDTSQTGPNSEGFAVGVAEGAARFWQVVTGTEPDPSSRVVEGRRARPWSETGPILDPAKNLLGVSGEIGWPAHGALVRPNIFGRTFKVGCRLENQSALTQVGELVLVLERETSGQLLGSHAEGKTAFSGAANERYSGGTLELLGTAYLSVEWVVDAIRSPLENPVTAALYFGGHLLDRIGFTEAGPYA